MIYLKGNGPLNVKSISIYDRLIVLPYNTYREMDHVAQSIKFAL